MAGSAELAFKEASDSGSLLGGKKIEVVRADSTCVDSAAATAAAEGVISQGVAAIMGADCSGVTGANRIKCCCTKWCSNDFTISYFTRINNFR
jgi:branched-chain amino acid transport system substrate-binding protein